MTDEESALVFKAIGQAVEDLFGQSLSKHQAQPAEGNLTCYTIDIPEAPSVVLKLYAYDGVKPWDQVAWNTLVDWLGTNGYNEDVLNENIAIYNPSEEEFAAAFDGTSEPVNRFINSIYDFAMKNDLVSKVYEKIDNPKGFLRNCFQKMSASYFEIIENNELYARFRLLRFARSRTLPLTPAPLVLMGSIMMTIAYLNNPENKEVTQDVKQLLEALFQ
ncbi:MAG: hypothetical protein IKZ87_04190 [Actinomycetaceae bacterium]|nr:hypothetical protein [Actinomycetaceae bacterium]